MGAPFLFNVTCRIMMRWFLLLMLPTVFPSSDLSSQAVGPWTARVGYPDAELMPVAYKGRNQERGMFLMYGPGRVDEDTVHLYALSDGGIADTPMAELKPYRWMHNRLVDLNNNGHPDMVGTSASRGLVTYDVFTELEDTAMYVGGLAPWPEHFERTTGTVVDCDGDGLLDVLWGSSGKVWMTFTNAEHRFSSSLLADMGKIIDGVGGSVLGVGLLDGVPHAFVYMLRQSSTGDTRSWYALYRFTIPAEKKHLDTLEAIEVDRLEYKGKFFGRYMFESPNKMWQFPLNDFHGPSMRVTSEGIELITPHKTFATAQGDPITQTRLLGYDSDIPGNNTRRIPVGQPFLYRRIVPDAMDTNFNIHEVQIHVVTDINSLQSELVGTLTLTRSYRANVGLNRQGIHSVLVLEDLDGDKRHDYAVCYLAFDPTIGINRIRTDIFYSTDQPITSVDDHHAVAHNVEVIKRSPRSWRLVWPVEFGMPGDRAEIYNAAARKVASGTVRSTDTSADRGKVYLELELDTETTGPLWAVINNYVVRIK